MYLLEICAANIQSALAAQRAGANRIDLCCALDAGGLTPSPGLLRAVLQAVQIPVNVLIRPREGNFCYSKAELDIILDDIRFCRDAGAAGVVIGALDASSQLDIRAMQTMLAAAEGMDITCHRAFDFVPAPFETLEMLIQLGIPRVLSSGQASTAFEGRILLKKLVEQAAGRISIMPGAGISPATIRLLAQSTGAREFHLSGRKKVFPKNAGRNIPGLYLGHWESNDALIREVLIALQR